MKPEELNIPKEKFALVNENKKLKDKELVTKPIGFFMDAMHRFAKNKGSIVGAIVIGVLVLYAIIIPIFSQYTVSYHDSYYRFTLPKVFNSEHFDFLDGCTNKNVNETTFLYYYSMGVETGHNAIKRQDYTTYTVTHQVNGVDVNYNMYKYREDSYQKIGTVFLTGVTVDEYREIQKYQDNKNIQIIYPITDYTQRPEATQNSTDANYWFKTKMEGSISVPDEYTINEDGTVTFTNIYSPYTVGALSSSSSFKQACKIKFEDKDGGYAVYFNKSTLDSEGNAIEAKEYLSCYYFNEEEVVVCVDEIDDASTFTYDALSGILKTQITGHENPSDDGNYCLALPSTSGANALLIKESEITNTNYAPFVVYSSENDAATSIDTASSYYFVSTKKSTESTIFYYAGTDIETGEIKSSASSSSAKKITLIEESGNYLINVADRIASYLCASADGNNTVLSTNGLKSDATQWTYDATLKCLKTTVNGHTDATNDGEYALALNLVSGDNFKIVLAPIANIDSANNLYPLNLYEKSTVEASTIGAGSYYLCNKQEAVLTSKYFANGDFYGDNYTSKMRIEGDDTYLYSYARPTNGTYELRVNYYEYYIYYHKNVAKDRITQPYFIFGTTSSGQDIFTCLASGARFSFMLAIIVASINLFVGAIYGAIEGYYGGKIDLVMERIVEILSAVPFMIVITLLKYHMGGTSHAVILFISFFLTGWIGMSGTVRMQFYRFKNQEYVLASRTLGAKDLRIMFKHIFPNALGTIVTSCVLVIPGMIFSETSLSYLGIINLNSGSMTSVGTLLANAQPYLVSYPHMILFPAIFISLLMLCFNLFGNGLRDAFNPSLRGTED